jgi:hypothetical protein
VVSSSELSAQVSALAKAGELIKIGPKLYIPRPRVQATEMEASIKQVVRTNWYPIVAELMPGALIVDRTALENAPADDGSVCVVSDRHSSYELPGLLIRPRQGPGPIEGEDREFYQGLYLSCEGRAFLENLQHSRARKNTRRTLPVRDLEKRLDQILRDRGEEALNAVRDQAKRVCGPLSLEPEFEKLSGIIGTLMGTRKATLYSETGRARIVGRPFDPDRSQLFTTLWHHLSSHALFPVRPLRSKSLDSVLPFYDAYFSNFIEGTQFKVEEAEDIIFNQKIPVNRPKDAHDILGTYRVIANERDMQRTPQSLGNLLELLRDRHSSIMGGRPEYNPGLFKTEANRAGATVFVTPELIMGTLEKGFELYENLHEPFARALFMHFMILEVHPFNDGNGRVSRIMMNAELVSEGQQSLIIPQVYRTEYLSGLKALSQNGNTGPLVPIMAFAQRYTHEVDFSDLKIARQVLSKTCAFDEPATALGDGSKLVLPSTLGVEVKNPTHRPIEM